MEESTLRWPIDKEREEMEEVCLFAAQQDYAKTVSVRPILNTFGGKVTHGLQRKIHFDGNPDFIM